MKTMTCKQLGGACDLKFHAETFEEMADLSKAHGREMFRSQDIQHMEAMQQMMELMQQPEDMDAWFKAKQNEFDALPHDE